MTIKNLVSTQWLHKHLQDEGLVVLYTQMDNPVTGVKETSPGSYIPGSVFFDFECVFCDRSSNWPHSIPSSEEFSKELAKLGVSKDNVVVVYDNKGVYSSPRVWWMLRSMGVDRVYVLNGGLPKWQKENLICEPSLKEGQPVEEKKLNYHLSFFITAEQILDKQDKLQVLDARSRGRFYGTAPEPRKGLRSGHIPGSYTLPFTDIINGTELKSFSELTDIFESLDIQDDEPLVFSCGSGVTACILALAASEIGYTNLSVYDGSWSEWGAREDLPVEL